MKMPTQYVDPKSLFPTQFCLGYKEIEHKEKKIKSMSKKQFEDYLIEKVTPVIIGPKGKLYLIDHHHHARSLINLKKPRILIEIIADYSSLSMKKFIEIMVKNGYTNLKNENSKQMKFSQLPKSLEKMNHDYYRSLAWSVREKGGFEKVDNIPFFEFRWGEYFRNYITEMLIIDNFDIATEVGLEMCSHPKAKNLPGFLKNKKD